MPERIRKVRESYINYIANNHAFHAESSVSESLDGLLNHRASGSAGNRKGKRSAIDTGTLKALA